MQIQIGAAMGFLIFAIGFAAGWFTFRHLLNVKVNEIHDFMEKDLEKSNLKFEPKKVSIKFEKINGLIYVYNRKTDHFITKGATYEEVVDNLEKWFPDTVFLATPGSLKQVKNDSLSV
ncbi:MAG: hypothetical protein ACO3UU_07025 [Minisyncoccia bacterium]